MYMNTSALMKPTIIANKENTLAIFDYDDTLFPTTALKKIMKQTSMRLSTEQINEMCELSKLVYTVLNCYIMDFNVVIVTASEKGWIQQSLTIISKLVKN